MKKFIRNCMEQLGKNIYLNGVIILNNPFFIVSNPI